MPRRPAVPDAAQLALFGDAAPPGTARAGPPAPGSGPRGALLPPEPQGPAAERSTEVAAVCGAREPRPTEPRFFGHPQAQREVRFGEHVVAYALRRARRRSIGFVVGTEGLSVAAPRWVGIGDIEQALHEKSSWILRKLVEQRERAQRLHAARVDWRDGTSIPFLGEPVIVVLDARATGALLNAGGESLPGVARLTLHVGLPHTATPGQIRDAVQSWLQRQARRVFEERCAHYAARLGVHVKRLTLSSAQTRWGSARADGSVWLNWRLVHFAMPTIDYVVAHELAHLRHMDHSPRFWNVVRSVIPNVEAARHQLRDDVLPVFD